jgi:fatty-acyl-CoA synthase
MDLLARHAAAHPDTPAVIEGERQVSWRRYDDMRNRLAHALAGLGLAESEHAVLYAHNALEVLLASAAVRALGAVPVPMNHRLTAEEVAYILEDSDAVAVFASDAFVPMLERVRERAPRLRHVVLLGEARRRAWAAR